MFNFRQNREINRVGCYHIAIICLVMLGSITLSNVWAQAPKKPQIAFTRKVNGQHWKIHLMDIDGKNVRQLTKGVIGDGGLRGHRVASGLLSSPNEETAVSM